MDVELKNGAGGDAPGDEAGKEAIYTKISEYVKAKTGRRLGKSAGREVFDLVVSEFFGQAVKDGTFRFNQGYGSLHVRDYQAGTRRLPKGREVAFGERRKLRYDEGLVVKDLIKSNGDMVAAKALRESRKTVATPPA